MKKTLNYLSTLLSNNDKLVVGVSGGPDSMCLLHILNSLKDKYKLKIVVAHINHNVRSDSAKEEKFVKDYCEKIDVLFESIKIKSYGEDNFHSEARDKRYNFYEKLIKKHKAKYLMTAHHGDDLVETILMRIARGSNLKGYSGFKVYDERYNYGIVKPLIFLSRTEIMQYLSDNNINYCTDSSNLKDDYTRNRYRHHILPFLKEEDKNIHEKFLKYHNVLESHNKYFEKIVKEEICNIYKEQKFDLKKFKKLDNLIQGKIIEELFHIIYIDDLSLINDQHVKLLLNVIQKNGNTSIMLPNNVEAIKTYDTLTFEHHNNIDSSYNIELKDKVLLSNNKSIKIAKRCDLSNNSCTRINSKEITLPLYVKTRSDGDKMAVKNMVGTKKINDIFIDEKISKKLRDTWPIVIDADNQIVWLPGLKKSKFDKEINETYDIILKYE